MKPRNFEEALDQLADDNRALWGALDNIVTLWDIPRNSMDDHRSIRKWERSLARARTLLGDTKAKCKINDLTTDDLRKLLRLADNEADHYDDNEEVHETYTALAEKTYAVIMKMEQL